MIQDKGRKEQVWFYSHWGGIDLPKILQEALIFGKSRWQDYPYLTRIIISRAVGDQWQEETGFGVSCQIGDNEHTILVVDIPIQRVCLIEEESLNTRHQIPHLWEPEADQEWSFEEFCKIEKFKAFK